jgi:hypothetical protein
VGRNRIPVLGFGRTGSNEKLRHFQYLVSQLDSIRAFRRVHPSKLEEPVTKTGTTNMWNRIKPAVERIVFLPETIPGLASLIRVAATLRLLFPLCFFSFILGILVRIGIFALANVFLYNLLLIAPIVIMLSFVVVDFTIRRRVARYEGEHPDLHVEEKQQVKSVVEEILIQFIREMKLYKESPDRYQMKLYFNDYRGITVIGERREAIFGVFKRRYSTYTARLALDYKGRRK